MRGDLYADGHCAHSGPSESLDFNLAEREDRACRARSEYTGAGKSSGTAKEIANRQQQEQLFLMFHKILPVGLLQCNCSIIGDEQTHEAMVIDPGDHIEEILKILHQANLTLKYIVITHAHIDHIGGAMKLKAATGAPILLNQNDLALLKMLDMQAAWLGAPPPGPVQVDESVTDGQKLKIGNISSQVIQTPGHTEGSICLLFSAEKKLIAGDTLFAGSIGRTDLPGGSYDKIMRSLHTQLMALPDDIEVVPGHGPLTTIGRERKTNPFLS